MHRGFREFWSDCFRHGLISTHGERWTGSGSSAPEQQRERYDWVRSDCAVAMNMSQNFGSDKETRRPRNSGIRRNRVRAVDTAGRVRAMTLRIAASILAIFAAGGLIAPVATSAQGGALNGGRTAPVHGVFRAPPPAMAPLRPAVTRARIRPAPFGQLRHRRTPAVVWGAAPWYDAYDAAWDNGSDAPWDSGVENPTYAVPGRDPDSTNRNATCRTQTYQVRSAEDGGERTVNIVRC